MLLRRGETGGVRRPGILPSGVSRRHSPLKRYILWQNCLHCHTSCAKLSNQMERPIDDLTGRKFGRWIVLPRDDFESNYRRRKWLVQCECGKLRLVAGQDLLNGRSASCGCASHRKSTDDGKTSARGLALRTRLQRVMTELRPERLESWAKSEGVRESDLIDEDTQSDWRMIV
jgi:hypothetical protein